jgi:hypothetical protein
MKLETLLANEEFKKNLTSRNVVCESCEEDWASLRCFDCASKMKSLCSRCDAEMHTGGLARHSRALPVNFTTSPARPILI